MDRRKGLVFLTAVFAFALLLIGIICRLYREEPSLKLEPQDYPTVGMASAAVEIVSFEEFRCTNCRKFSLEVYPQIDRHYIQTGRVRYTMIPLAFIEGSKPIANAAWAVYRLFPDQFFSYVHTVMEEMQLREIDASTLLQIAKNLEGIDLAQLQMAIIQESYFDELDQNLAWTEQVLGEEFTTPAIYVDGKRVAFPSWETMREQIEKSLKQKRKSLSAWYRIDEAPLEGRQIR